MRTEAERRMAADKSARAMGIEPSPFQTSVRTHHPEVFRGSAIQMEPAMAREFVDWAADAIGSEPTGHLDREVFVQPFPGQCGLAGYVITVDATPCHLCVFLMLEPASGECLLLTFDGRRVETLSPGASGTAKRKRTCEDVIGFIKRMGLPAKAEVAMCDVNPLYQQRTQR